MPPEISPALQFVCNLCLAAMFVAGLLSLFRLLIGPRAADRAVAMDMLTSVFIGIICILCMLWGESWYFDAVWILTLVGFIGSAAMARYIEKGKVF